MSVTQFYELESPTKEKEKKCLGPTVYLFASWLPRDQTPVTMTSLLWAPEKSAALSE